MWGKIKYLDYFNMFVTQRKYQVRGKKKWKLNLWRKFLQEKFVFFIIFVNFVLGFLFHTWKISRKKKKE